MHFFISLGDEGRDEVDQAEGAGEEDPSWGQEENQEVWTSCEDPNFFFSIESPSQKILDPAPDLTFTWYKRKFQNFLDNKIKEVLID